MVSISANVRMSPLGILFATITVISTIFYFRDMIKKSNPVKKLSDFANQLKLKGYNVVWLHAKDVSLKELLVASIEVAKKGGIKVKQVRESNKLRASSKGQTDEGVDDPLTQGDLLSHRTMYHSFKKMWQDILVISEEKDNVVPMDITQLDYHQTDKIDSFLTDKTDEKVLKTDVVIWIDPLDATKEYSENLTKYVTTMVCVVVKGKPVIGVIHKPFNGETIWAWQSHGHNVPIQHEDKKRTSPWIIVSRSHAGNVNQTASKAFDESIRVIPAGGAGYKVASLVKGSVDVYLHTTKIKKWDVCAGNAILNTLSGKMTDRRGKNIIYDKDNGVVLEHGLLATMSDHQKYLQKLGDSS